MHPPIFNFWKSANGFSNSYGSGEEHIIIIKKR